MKVPLWTFLHVLYWTYVHISVGRTFRGGISGSQGSALTRACEPFAKVTMLSIPLPVICFTLYPLIMKLGSELLGCLHTHSHCSTPCLPSGVRLCVCWGWERVAHGSCSFDVLCEYIRKPDPQNSFLSILSLCFYNKTADTGYLWALGYGEVRLVGLPGIWVLLGPIGHQPPWSLSYGCSSSRAREELALLWMQPPIYKLWTAAAASQFSRWETGCVQQV